MKKTGKGPMKNRKIENIVVLTGAGISADSGIQTFRGADGLWCGHRVEDVATPEAFRRNPDLVQEFYNMRRRQLLEPEIKPNPAHLALAELERKWHGRCLLVTQNIDDLHDRAGNRKLIHMHGELLKVFCTSCTQKQECHTDIDRQSACTACKMRGTLRPDIVWFGEMPYRMDEIFDSLTDCDLFLSIGTSGNVYPAAGFVAQATMNGAYTVELNLEPSLTAGAFHEHLVGRAAQTVPNFVKKLLEQNSN